MGSFGRIFFIREDFFVRPDSEDKAEQDNISISVGKNDYSTEEHPAFREAIVEQLLLKLKNIPADLKGDGTYTKQKYPLYIFHIREHENGLVTELYYIVDDFRYCLVQLTNHTGRQENYEAARALADSFIWDDKPSSFDN